MHDVDQANPIDRAVATPVLLKAEALYFRYPQRDLFAGWSALIGPGVTLVRGDESSGKTTLLRLLSGVLAADRGHLQANGVVLDEQPAAYRQQVFWADPRSDLHDQVVAADYLESQRRLYARFDEQRLATLVEGFALAPHLDKPLYMLSTGSKRKVWLAAAFAAGATITLLDEPFAGLDKGSVGFVLEQLAWAAADTQRAWVVADHGAPANVPLAAVIALGV